MAQPTEREEAATFLRTIVARLGFMPSREYLSQVPSWEELVATADRVEKYGFEEFAKKVIPVDFLQAQEVEIPSLEQRLVGAKIAHQNGDNVFLLDAPGTRKTGAALCARAIMEAEYLPPGQERIPIFITCPGYIIPTWMNAIQRFLPEGRNRVITITRENREAAISRAAAVLPDAVIVSYDMTFRKAGNGDSQNGNGVDYLWRADREIDLAGELPTRTDALERLSQITDNDTVQRLMRKRLDLDHLIGEIVREELRRANSEGDEAVIGALRRQVFTDDVDFYAIVDEHHNIVDPNGVRARSIADITRPARWKVLASGTGIGNNLETGLVYASFAAGLVDDPQDIRALARERSPRRYRAFLDSAAIHPIRTLADIDSEVKEPLLTEKPYNISPEEMDLVVALMNTDLFDGRERYLLFRYALANPQRLLPERFSHLSGEDDSLLRRVEEFYEQNRGLEETVRNAPQSRILHTKELVREVVGYGAKCLVACELTSGITKPLEAALAEFGAIRIDETVTADLREHRLTAREADQLELYSGSEIYAGDEVFRSELTPRVRTMLKFSVDDLYRLSDRDQAILTLATSKHHNVGVTTRILREGVELREVTYVIDFDPTTVPSRETQYLARSIRSGQREQVHIWRPICNQLKLEQDERI